MHNVNTEAATSPERVIEQPLNALVTRSSHVNVATHEKTRNACHNNQQFGSSGQFSCNTRTNRMMVRHCKTGYKRGSWKGTTSRKNEGTIDGRKTPFYSKFTKSKRTKTTQAKTTATEKPTRKVPPTMRRWDLFCDIDRHTP